MSTESYEDRIERLAGASPRRSSAGTCDASYVRGGRCPHAAKHTHRTQAGNLLALCGVHLRTIKRRERLGSDEELTARWRER